MSSIEVVGQAKLMGELKIQGSKNAALPIIAATILNKGLTVLHNCPKILDVFHMITILEELGCRASWEGNTLIIDSSAELETRVSEESVRKMRSSILYMGALLGRCHEVTIAFPGGCSIGKRPIDYHLDALKKMNVKQDFLGNEDNIIHCTTDRITGNDIFLKFPSVGATQNIILAAALSEGVTRIYNAAREPEVIELCNYLLEAGARICGRGSAFIEIEGVRALHDVEFTLSSDRIVTGTYMAAAAITKGDVILNDAPIGQLDAIIRVLKKTGCDIGTESNRLRISCNRRPISHEVIKTKPYPGFPTDMQSQMMSVLSIADGESIIIEEIFESRFQNVDELMRMGAIINIDVPEKKVIITGVNHLSGATVTAHDLRGGAALIIAGLAAYGNTIIKDATCIERGYEDICRDLSSIGADIRYCSENAS